MRSYQLTGFSATCSNTSVNDKRWQDLTGVVAALAADSILIQRRMDQVTELQRERFVALLAATPDLVRSLLLPLVPPTQLVKSHTVSCSLRMTKTHSASGSIMVSPINLGHALLYETSPSEQSSLTIEVQSIPKQAAKQKHI